MNSIKLRAVLHLIVAAVVIAAALGLAPARALAQQGNQPPAPSGPPPAAEPRAVPAPPPGPANGAGWLGVTMSEVTPEKAREVGLNDVHGVVVTGITQDSPAAKAGLAGGDIITDFRGQRVEGMLELARLVRETPPGRVVRLSVWRERGSREFSVEIGRASRLLSGDLLPPDFQDRVRQFQERLERRFDRSAPRPSANGAGAPALGVIVQDVSGQFADYLKVPESQGALVTSVQAGSAAERGGLRAGDVIIAVDGQRVRNAAELRAQVRRTNETRTAVLRVIRDGAETTVNVELVAAQGPGAQPNDRSSSTPI